MDNKTCIKQNTELNMLDNSFAFKSISELVTSIKRREISPIELLELMQSRIDQFDDSINSFLSLNPHSRQEAEASEQSVMKGESSGPLCGIPFSVKDIIETRSLPTTGGSKVFGKGLQAAHDADVVKHLRQAGGILLGKTNLHEFAFGITSENEHFGPVRNPWNLNHVAGGSSGGSAAAVVMGMSIGSIGTDTRGSIRIPSACCGATGLKPTLNAVSTKGVLPLSWTLDHVGPITTSVWDAAILVSVASGQANLLEKYESALAAQIGKFRIGVCPYFFVDVDPVVESSLESAIEIFKGAGVEIVSVEIEGLDDALEASDIIGRAEAVTIHDANLSQKPDCYGSKVRERLSSGYRVTGIDLVRAERIRLKTIEAFRRAFLQVDCLVAPTLPVVAPPLGTEIVRSGNREEAIVNQFVRFNAPQNVAGLPALALPCGFTENSLPIGMQLIAWRGREELLFNLGAHFQRTTKWHQMRPPLAELT